MKAVLELMTNYQEFASMDDLTVALSDQIACTLSAAIEARGKAVLAVSGGSTPEPVYRQLSFAPINWSKVTIVLVDDRWVDPGLAGSNETFVRNCLLQDLAAKARFVGLKTPHGTPAEAVDAVNERLAILSRPFDAVVLGMGNDGHTASWFPEAEGLEAALNDDTLMATAVTAERSDITGPFVERMTLTRSALRGARFTALLLKGTDKRSSWARVIGPGPIEEMPVRALLNDPAIDLSICWAP